MFSAVSWFHDCISSHSGDLFCVSLSTKDVFDKASGKQVILPTKLRARGLERFERPCSRSSASAPSMVTAVHIVYPLSTDPASWVKVHKGIQTLENRKALGCYGVLSFFLKKWRNRTDQKPILVPEVWYSEAISFLEESCSDYTDQWLY